MRWKYAGRMKRETRKKVWKVRDKRGNIGFFKYPYKRTKKSRKHRQMLVNEYLAISLAKSLGFPVANFKPAMVSGPDRRKVRGYISRRVNAKEVITWERAKKEVKYCPEWFVNDIKRLAQVIVFDAWILNKDRTSVNLVLYRDSTKEKYNWYLIDHGSALLGSPTNSPFARVKGFKHPQLKKSMRIPTGMKKVVLSNRSAVDEMVNRIQGLPESEITRAIDTVPKQLALTKRKKEFLRRLLQYRQKCIDLIMLDILDQIKQNKPGLL
jgi:hypothetical protein